MTETAFIVAADYLRTPRYLVASAVIFPRELGEPMFSVPLAVSTASAPRYLYSSVQVPTSLLASLQEKTAEMAVGWARVYAHKDQPAPRALALAIARALERWSYLAEDESAVVVRGLRAVLPVRRQLRELPGGIQQMSSAQDWRVGAARIMCYSQHPEGVVTSWQ